MPASLCGSYEPLGAFDEKAEAWDDYTNTPMGRLRRDLTMRYLSQHIDPLADCLEVLDIGGGTGSYALPLAQLGHRVCLLDFSPRMLAIARHKVSQGAFTAKETH